MRTSHTEPTGTRTPAAQHQPGDAPGGPPSPAAPATAAKFFRSARKRASSPWLIGVHQGCVIIVVPESRRIRRFCPAERRGGAPARLDARVDAAEVGFDDEAAAARDHAGSAAGAPRDCSSSRRRPGHQRHGRRVHRTRSGARRQHQAFASWPPPPPVRAASRRAPPGAPAAPRPSASGAGHLLLQRVDLRRVALHQRAHLRGGLLAKLFEAPAPPAVAVAVVVAAWRAARSLAAAPRARFCGSAAAPRRVRARRPASGVQAANEASSSRGMKRE